MLKPIGRIPKLLLTYTFAKRKFKVSPVIKGLLSRLTVKGRAALSLRRLQCSQFRTIVWSDEVIMWGEVRR